MVKTLSFIFVMITSSYAQFEGNYIPLSSDSNLKTKVISEINLQLEDDLKQFSRKEKLKYKEVFQMRANGLLKGINEDVFIFGSVFNEKLESVLNEIKANNLVVKNKNIRVLLSKDSDANAFCLGEGTVIVNLGLFRYLENDDQLAFVICHELAHYVLNHVSDEIERQIEKDNDPKVLSALETISKQKYNRQNTAFKLYKDSIYSSRELSRKKEQEADSLGVVFLNRTKFKVFESLNSLKHLDESDREKYVENFDFKKVLKGENLEFQEKWLKEKSSSLSGFKKEISSPFKDDSLKTHPDCKKRIEFLKKAFGVYNQDALVSENFKKLNKIADFEVVQSEFGSANYINSLYRTVGLLHEYPQNMYLNVLLINTLYNIYDLQKKHEFLIETYSQFVITDKNYTLTKLFIKNVSLTELKDLTLDFYIRKKKESIYIESHAFKGEVASFLNN